MSTPSASPWTSPVKRVRGAFQMLNRRHRDLRVSGLNIWTDAGRKAVEQIARDCVADAYKAETCGRDAADKLRKAISDGIGESDRPLIEAAIRQIERSANANRKLGEFLKG